MDISLRTRTVASTGLLLFVLLSGCASGVTGTWTGRMVSPHNLGVRYVLVDHAGTLTGQVFWEDPLTHRFELEGGLGAVPDLVPRWRTGTQQDRSLECGMRALT